MKVAACFCIHDDVTYLSETIGVLSRAAVVGDPTALDRAGPPTYVFGSRQPWHAQPGDWQAAAATGEALGAIVVLGDWSTELAQRQAAIGGNA